MHLTQYCQDPSLLCHAQRGVSPKKHSNEQMLSGSHLTKFQQQIWSFDLFTSQDQKSTGKINCSIDTLLCFK
jgi:hypothetical protein